MVTACLSNYKAFDYVKRVQDTLRESNRKGEDCLGVVRKVGIAALAILAFPPVFIADLFLMAASFCYRRCEQNKPPIGAAVLLPKPLPPIPVVAAQIVKLEKMPSEKQIDDLLGDAFGFGESNHPLDIFKNSINLAYKFDPAIQPIYDQLLVDWGELDGDGLEPPDIDIFKWSAGCFIVLSLISDKIWRLDLPLRHDLDEKFKGVNRKEKAAALLQVLLPQTKWELTGGAKNLVNHINAKAQEMSQTPDFIRLYNEAYPHH